MAQTIGVVCGEDGQPLRVEYRALPPNNEVLRGVLAVRPGGMLVFEQLQEQPVIAETNDDADFRMRTEDEIRSGRARLDAATLGSQLGTIGTRELDEVGGRRVVGAPAPVVREPLQGPAAPAEQQQQQVAEDERQLVPPGPPQPPRLPSTAVDDLVQPPDVAEVL